MNSHTIRDGSKKRYPYIIDNGSQGNTITQYVVNELSLQTEPYGAQANTWGNMIDLLKSVILTITVYNINSQPYHYNSCFFVTLDNAPAPFILRLPFLVNANLNHKYDTGKFLWKKVRHTIAH